MKCNLVTPRYIQQIIISAIGVGIEKDIFQRISEMS